MIKLNISKSKNWMRFWIAAGIVSVAIVFASMVTTNLVTTKAQSNSWQLKEIKVFKKMTGYSAITTERYDKTGGDVEINVSGNALNMCPGGSEKIRYTWRFPDNITQVPNGGGVTVNLEAGVASYSKPCTGHNIAEMSVLAIQGSRGNSSPLSPEENKLIDGDKFERVDDKNYVNASDGRQTSSTGVRAKNWPNSTSYPLAWFEITVGTRAGDNVRYVYIYQHVGSGGGGGGGGGGSDSGAFTIENNVDRMYGDYKDFDLSEPRWESCRDACANDRNCRAFTYVKPGAQAASARCWLKSTVNTGYANSNCITGVKK